MTEPRRNERPRPGGPTLNMLWDVVAHARAARAWFLLVMLVAIGLAVASAWVGHAVVPWVIYPAL